MLGAVDLALSLARSRRANITPTAEDAPVDFALVVDLDLDLDLAVDALVAAFLHFFGLTSLRASARFRKSERKRVSHAAKHPPGPPNPKQHFSKHKVQ